jgi:hypothetical protein
MIRDGELERMWNKEVVAYFKALSQHLPSDTEESYKKTQDSWSQS